MPQLMPITSSKAGANNGGFPRGGLAPLAARMRARQIRLAARALNGLSSLPSGRRLIRVAQRVRPASILLRAAVGYHSTFSTLEEAEAAVAPYANGGHENPANAALHLNLSAKPRPSDYAVLFHLERWLPDIHRVFDLGGNVGNLYYCYSNYLSFPPDLIWMVHDLPDTMRHGVELAATHHAGALRFTRTWSDASGADVLLLSGCLHYIPRPLPEMVAELPLKPTRIVINRTPLTQGEPVATVQDTGTFKVACMLHNKEALVRSLEALGYRLTDSWQAAELSLKIPGRPEHSIPAYSGLLLERR